MSFPVIPPQQRRQQQIDPLAILAFKQRQQNVQAQQAMQQQEEQARQQEAAMRTGLDFISANPEGDVTKLIPLLRPKGLTLPQEQFLVETGKGAKKRAQGAAQAPAREAIGQLAATRKVQPTGGPLSIDDLGRRLSSSLPGEQAEIKGFAQGSADMERSRLDRAAAIRAAEVGTLSTIKVEEARDARRRTQARGVVMDEAKDAKLSIPNPSALVRAQENKQVFRDPLFRVDAIGKPDDAALQISRLEVLEWAARYQSALEDLAVNEGAGAITDLDQFLSRRGIGGEPSQRVQNVQFLKNVTGQAIARAREKGRLSDQDVSRSMDLLLQTAEARVGADGKLIGSSRRQLDSLMRMLVVQYSGSLSGTYNRGGVRKGVRETYDEMLALERIRNETFAEGEGTQSRPGLTPMGTSRDGNPLFRSPDGQIFEDVP